MPIAEFGALPSVGRPVISPNGKFVAIPMRRGNQVLLSLLDVDQKSIGDIAQIASADQEKGVFVAWVAWANDERILVSVAKPLTIQIYGIKRLVFRSKIIGMNRDGSNQVVLFGAYNPSLAGAGYSTGGGISHTLPNDPDHVIIPAAGKKVTGVFLGSDTIDAGAQINLYKVNIVNGTATLLAAGNDDTVDWQTDQAGNPRVRIDYSYRSQSFSIFGRPLESDSWNKLAEFSESSLNDFQILGFTDDARFAIVSMRNNRDHSGIYEYDISAKRVIRTVFEVPGYDVGGLGDDPTLTDSETGKLLGVRFVDDYVQDTYFDPALTKIQGMLDGNFRGAATVSIVSASRDRSRVVFVTRGPREPGTFQVLDANAKKLTLIGKVRPTIPATALGDVQILKYASRDGTKIPGYLTLPPGKGNKGLPLIVMPHGGPESRDYVEFDAWAQSFANRGYAVFQPNFRGSSGYGRAYQDAGHRQWGRRMQDDITDGVKALIADGTADANRICIVGASYGGYAALAGGSLTPELYKCVVSVAGVSDLPEMLAWERRESGREDSFRYQYWVKLLGDPAKNADELKAFSPAFMAAKFTAPVLLIHGTEDENVPVEQSKMMFSALKAAGKEVRYVEFEGEDHHYRRGQDSTTQMFTEVEKFVSSRLGAGH